MSKDIEVVRHIRALKQIMLELNCEADVALAILRLILCGLCGYTGCD